ncbi:putative quinoprotein alcohol dehydrogenase-like superfamily [Medicago truncatula]|uniref:Gamete protein n=1 Tax=Medicago truncatula TaxID=3880 RepID=A0A072U841_MEDTR|nr:gamete protein [Medicago truncatula]RHN50385.1 putative quinoprotein alcohol dehydrogenase-like superfamily [Medicago truncatula]
MMLVTWLLLLLVTLSLVPAALCSVCSRHLLSKPLIGDDGRIYVCSDKTFLSFETNGTIAWSIHVDYKCNVGLAPVHAGLGKIYLVAENRILKIDYGNIGISEPAVELFFGPEPGQKAETKIIGLSVSTLSSTVFINVKNRGLFAYLSHGRLLWSLGPALYQFGYRQGCRKNLTDCYFSSVPVLDQCEASIYIANTEGELYCLSVRGRDFRWIQDFSSLDKSFTITPGNNGHLYVTVPTRALILALDVFTGNILWQGSVGPLSKIDCAPVVDSNGWISIGSLDGFLYSFSPTGILKKFSRKNTENSIAQVGPFLDCSGFAVYSSQIEMEGKVSHGIGEYTVVSAIRPKAAIFTMLVPATGSIYWSEGYPGKLSTLLSKSDLSQFVVNEEILLTFIAASKVDTPLQCRTTGQKLASSCSQARNKLVNIYSGNERTIEFFLLFESFLLVLLIGLVRFCCTFWAKRKLQDQGLGSFLDKRCSLQLQKKALVKTISELEKKSAEESVDNEVYEKLGDTVRKKENIERKLSTTYSLGRDRTNSKSKSMLPLQIGKRKSYSFQGAKKQKLKMFDTLSDASSESSIEGERDMVEVLDSSAKEKGKTPMVEVTSTSSNDEDFINPLDVT